MKTIVNQCWSDRHRAYIVAPRDKGVWDLADMEEILLDDLYELRDKLLEQMMQALAAQYGLGALERLSRRASGRVRKDVMGYLREFDLSLDKTQGDIKPQSPFEALMVQWWAINADIDELEGFEKAASDYARRK